MDMKKIIVLLICALMIVPVTYGDRNIKENEFEGMIQIEFVSIAEFRNDFSIDASGKAGLFSILDAYDGSEVVISAYLQRYQNGQWINIKHWSVEEPGTYAEMDVSWYIASGYMYRMTSYGYVYENEVMLESDYFCSNSIWY